MNEKALKILEYNKIIEMLTGLAHSKGGKKLCENLKPSNIFSDVIESQQNTEDAVSRIIKNGSLNFAGNKEVLASLKQLMIGGALSAGAILDICDCLENTGRVKSYLRKENPDEKEDSLYCYYDVLEPLTNVSNEIRRIIVSEDEIADSASPTLHNIRRHMKLTMDKVHTELNRMVNSTYRTYLQDNVITMRDGRYCIPVKAEYKGNVPGIVHDTSGSNSTFFIEPSSVVNLNNELRQLAIDEAKEIEVILYKLSNEIGEHVEEIKVNSETLSTLDFIFAKGNLALKMDASRPLYNVYGHVNLKKARHPMLDKKKAVPISVKLGFDYDLLVVTGPNTGGKTVALKTIGLLTLMGQAGLMIPASDTSELSIFDNVFADIGDEQSIEQSLSTFSSHMKNIVEILKEADNRSLCLFDELGAGTDPTEGAALAISVLNDLHKRHVKSVATTHYSELKVYALNEPGVENACCEFDVETLRPTYRILIGIPGKSNAFAISSKLGLSDYIIEDAKGRISNMDETFEDVISKLEENKVTIENDKLEIKKYKDEIEKLKAEYEEKLLKLNASRDKILREASEEAKNLLKEAKDTVDETIRDINKNEKAGNIKGLEKNRTKLREKMKKASVHDEKQETVSIKNKLSDFKIGEEVKIVSMNLTGTVSSVPNAKGNLFVQCGIMKIEAKMDDILFLKKGETAGAFGKKKFSGASKSGLSKAYSMSTEINLIGRNVDDALYELDKYLDDAYLSKLGSVRVVHGKGTGTLRNAIHAHLKKVKYVKSFKIAEYGEGDSGVTVVELS